MALEIVEGDLLNQPVDGIVNAWNRNTIPWWLLLPQGVSGAIKRQAGLQPFREVAKFGRLTLGQAVVTSAGRLPYRGIIHVAGINDFWRASEHSIRESVRNALSMAESQGWNSIAFPILGAGTGGFQAAKAEEIMRDEITRASTSLKVVLVRYQRPG